MIQNFNPLPASKLVDLPLCQCCQKITASHTVLKPAMGGKMRRHHLCNGCFTKRAERRFSRKPT